jgi:hypothetical protein
MLAEIDEALEEYYSGNAEVITCRTREDVRNLLKSL